MLQKKGETYKVGKINIFCAKLVLVLSAIIAIGGVLGVGIAYAAYTHTLLKPWGSDYQTATYKMQDTFGSITKSQTADAMVHWNGQLTKSFLYKSSVDTTDTTPSNNGVKTITKNNYGDDGVLAEHIPYYNFWVTYVVESDIRVNSFYPYANSAQVGMYDIQSILTHELGHALRVNHSTVSADTMFAESLMNSEAYRTVTAADKEAARDSTARWYN